MFLNRKQAAIELASKLEMYRDQNPLILAIPRGGVEIGYYIANKLNCPWSVIISRKLGYPDLPEAAFGAIAEDKSLYLNPRVRAHISKEIIEKVIQKEEIEIRRRIHVYRKGAPIPNIKGRTIILVDDGIATGSTLFASIEMIKKAGANKIVVAAPVSAIEVAEKLKENVDEVIILETPQNFFAVSQAYFHFENLTDRKVLKFLNMDIAEHDKSKKVPSFN